ncbi:hypothetical protein [Idiomarina sp.]|uniref:hypothetical protein n=1 Tax=Idiomarina sp. TaxID=1874361 RepID=UPI003A900979
MITHYEKVHENINSLLAFLNQLGIDGELKSHLESDYLLATDFLENFENGQQDQLTEDGRAAVGGLHELYKWLWSIKDCDEFDALIPHLKMLSQSATRINSKTTMLSPVTEKQDDKTNKLIETIVAMFAVKVGSEIDLDDPILSSGGDNPDIIFNYEGNRISIACKTLRGESVNTILDNFRSAAKQIKRADCDFGYIAINAMNILPHNNIVENVYLDLEEPFHELTSGLISTYRSLPEVAEEDLAEIFDSSKVRPVILTFVHSNTKLSSMAGNVSTMIKSTFASRLLERDSKQFDIDFLAMVNEFIHQRL